MTSLLHVLCLLALLILQACSSINPATQDVSKKPAQVKPGNAPIPGGYWMYSFGPGQTKENFENVDKAQYDYALWPGRHWGAMGALPKGPLGKASANRVGLQVYYPLYVRWKLKDGREFIAENIDVAAIIRECAITRSLKLQWQREERAEAKFGDYEPLLALEVKDDTVILKWILTINRTPVNHETPPHRLCRSIPVVSTRAARPALRAPHRLFQTPAHPLVYGLPAPSACTDSRRTSARHGSTRTDAGNNSNAPARRS